MGPWGRKGAGLAEPTIGRTRSLWVRLFERTGDRREEPLDHERTSPGYRLPERRNQCRLAYLKIYHLLERYFTK